jgi:pilus assembly protein CpaB
VGRRLALLIAAVLVAAVGTGIVFAYVRNADNRAIADQHPVTVLIAKTAIAPGTRVVDAANGGAFQTKELPQSAVAPGALSSVDPVKDQVVLGQIFPGQQLLAGMFGATAATTSSIAIPPGQIAASFAFGDPERVAGFLQPGSTVAVFVAYQNPRISGDLGKGLRLLLPKVTVIAVGPTTITPPANPAQANTEAVPRALMTFALTQRQAEKLMYATTNGGGNLYLALLNDKSKITPEPFSNPGITAANIFR